MDAHNMFDEMSTRVFTEEVEETSSSAILLGDLDDIQSTRVLDESVHSCFHKLVAEVQPDTPIKMLDEEALCLERSKVQLFNECSPRNMSKSVDVHGSVMNLCVWDLSISSKLKDLTVYTLNTKLLIFLGSTSTFGFIVNANSMTQGNEAPKAICIARLQGCIRSMADLIGMELRNFSTLAELKGLVGAQGDKIIVCPPTLSLYEVVAIQTCQNDYRSLYVIESELELMKVPSIVVAYVVHKAILSESKRFSVLGSCGKFKTMIRLMCYVAHLGGHRFVEECTVAQQVLKSNPVFKVLNNFEAIQSKFSSHNGIFVEIQFAKLGKTYGLAMGKTSSFIIIILEQNHHCFFLLREVLMEINKMCKLRGTKAFSYMKRSYCLAGITDAYDTPNIEKVMKIVGLSKAEQVTIFKILACVMMLSNMDLAKGNEIVSLILHVDNTRFHLCTTIAALYTHSSLERLNIILSVWLHSNLEGKVLIGEGSIVMNGPKSVMLK
ncbi:hypothetical protein CQW23_33803 [Capsicum baccatum]|uniref:Myosin motor domain-containing protein n=1 Tax=Capsicum baccatum TaxID=33114 RepID=A0A2G2V0R5_CAPBA|nr:hypothetical protein CQW23_33803 [Capsicum baccatum]